MMVKQGASAAKPPPAAAPKEGAAAAPFTSRPYRGARGNSQGRQSIGGGGPPATAAPASGSATAATVTGTLPPQAARPERFSGGAGKEEEMMGSRIRAVST
jgi:hypothetical protein